MNFSTFDVVIRKVYSVFLRLCTKELVLLVSCLATYQVFLKFFLRKVLYFHAVHKYNKNVLFDSNFISE